MLLNPEEALRMMKQPSEEPTTTTGELKHQFKRLSLIFSGKDKLLRKPISSKFKINNEENPIRQSFSNFLDSKSSLFSKKPKPETTVTTDNPRVDDDWTLV